MLKWRYESNQSKHGRNFYKEILSKIDSELDKYRRCKKVTGKYAFDQIYWR